jgi:hypothetical protein
VKKKKNDVDERRKKAKQKHESTYQHKCVPS